MSHERVVSDFESMFTPAELHPDLAAYINRVGKLGECLQHPLVYSVPYTPEMNNHYNKRYEMLKSAVAECLAEGNVHRYVFMHERPYRLNALVEFLAKQRVSDSDYWELLGSAWTDSENIWQNLSVWKRLLRSKRPQQELFMAEEDRKKFKDLPAQFTVYRGCVRHQNEKGMSWTLDRVKARWFSKRHLREGDTAHVVEKTIQKRQVFAYMGERNESEIIIL